MSFRTLYQFLNDLQANNSKEWMDLNRSYYHDVRDWYIDWLNGLMPADGDKRFSKGYRHTYPGTKIKDNKRLIEMISNYDDLINQKKFLGWPLSHEYGGYSLQKKLIGIRTNPNLSTMISEEDHHPNAEGQEVIAEFIYDRLG